MAYRYLDRCRFLTPTIGTGNITVGSALIGHQLPAAAGAVNGDIFYVIIEDGSQWEVAQVSYSSTGPTLTRVFTIQSTNSNAAISLSGSAMVTMTVPAVDTIPAQYLAGYISGLSISAPGNTTSFTVNAGNAMSEESASPRQMLRLPANITKTFASVWTPGNNGGALDTGLTTPGTWYHVHLIGPTVYHPELPVDVVASLSTSPAFPTNYGRSRRIGSVRFTGSNFVWNISQVGDKFIYPSTAQDYTNGSLGAAAHLNTLVPTGINVESIISGQCTGGATPGTFVYYGDGPIGTTSYSVAYIGAASQVVAWGPIRVMTDTGAQIYIASSLGVTGFNQWTAGYHDSRGKG